MDEMRCKLTVVSLVVVEFLVVQVDDVSAHVIQEALVVGNDEEGLLPALKVAARAHTQLQLIFFSFSSGGQDANHS